MPKLSLLAIALLGISLAGCAARIDSAHFGPPGAIERLVMRYYERNASEGNCFNPYIDGFTQLTVVADAPDRLVVDARYFFRDRFKNGGNGGGGDGCTGFAERTFVLGRAPDGAAIVVGMTGQQDEPALRSLIRRVLPR